MFKFSVRRHRKLDPPKKVESGQKVQWNDFKPRPHSILSRRSTADSDATLVGQLHDNASTPEYGISGKESIATSYSRPISRWRKPFRKAKVSASSLLLTSITIGEATDIPYLKGLAGVLLVIYNAVEATQLNHDYCLRMLSMVMELATTINNQLEGKVAQCPRLDHNIQSLETTLHQISDCLAVHAKRKYFLRVASTSRDRELLQSCEKALQHALDLFKFRSTMNTARAMSRKETADKEFSDLAMEYLETVKHSGYLEPTILCPETNLLPPSPKIFHGRKDEMNHILSLFSNQTSAHAVICGPGGVGKSSLARFFLHHPQTVCDFGINRFVVVCRRGHGLPGLVSSLLISLGLSPSSEPSEQQDFLLRHFHALQERSLVILDDLETIWDPATSRLETEDFLSHLTSIPLVSLVVTMRGTLRPLGPDWSKPYLPPLSPLDATSAKNTFVAISDLSEDDPDIDALLRAVDFYPLPVTILAHLAQYEPPNFLLERYRTEGSSMLSIGDDRCTDLDTSLAASFAAESVTKSPHALRLLEILATSSSAISQTELSLITQGIPSHKKCLAALCQNSLVMQDDLGFIIVPSPVRAHFMSASAGAQHR